ncbi:unnamed protein product [Ectocarpus sp. 12 AP-2014]
MLLLARRMLLLARRILLRAWICWSPVMIGLVGGEVRRGCRTTTHEWKVVPFVFVGN